MVDLIKNSIDCGIQKINGIEKEVRIIPSQLFVEKCKETDKIWDREKDGPLPPM